MRVDARSIARPKVAPTREPARERRTEPRLKPADERLWLGWWATRHEFQVVGARLLNISLGGAAAQVEDRPPAGSKAWLCLEGPTRFELVEASIVAADGAAAGPFVARMSFRDPCPEGLLQAALDHAVVV